MKLESFSPLPLSISARLSITKRLPVLPSAKSGISSFVSLSAIAPYGSRAAPILCSDLNAAYLSRSAGCFINLAVCSEFSESSSTIIAQATAFSRFFVAALSIRALIFPGFSFTYSMINSRCSFEYAITDFTAISKVASRSSRLPVIRTLLIGCPMNG